MRAFLLQLALRLFDSGLGIPQVCLRGLEILARTSPQIEQPLGTIAPLPCITFCRSRPPQFRLSLLIPRTRLVHIVAMNTGKNLTDSNEITKVCGYIFNLPPAIAPTRQVYLRSLSTGLGSVSVVAISSNPTDSTIMCPFPCSQRQEQLSRHLSCFPGARSVELLACISGEDAIVLLD